MSSIPVVKTQSDGSRSRCCQSSIPPPTSRPTSVLAHSPKKPLLSTPTSISSSAGLQTSSPTVQAWTYSRAQQSSLPSRRPTPLSSYESSRELLPESDSLLPYNQRPADYDLSGVRQQLQIRNYSTQLLAGVETALSSNRNGPSTSVTLPALRRLPKSKTSTTLAKQSLNLTPQRQLMKPIDPPLPRSQTMGNLSRFIGDGAKETPSPLKSDSNSLKSGSDKELGFMDVLQESRMTDHEVEIYKQVTRETQMNKQRMRRTGNTGKSHSTKDAREFSDSYSTTTGLILPHAEIVRSRRALKRFGKINVTKNEEMDLKLLRRDKSQRKDDRRLPMDGATTGVLSVDTNLPNFPNWFQQTPTSLRMSESGMIIESNPDEEWEVDVKLVYFHQEITYWTGRFSTLCDRLKTASARLVSSNFGAAVDSPSFQEVLDVAEPFEVAECRRTEYALKKLRSYCRTNAALSSFEEFEAQLRRQLEKRADAQRKLAQGPTTRSAEEVIPGHKSKSEFKPKLVWHFGQSQTSNIAGKAIATVGATTRKQAPMMVKSKTTSNLASVLDGGNDIRATLNANASSISDAKSLPGLNWQRPTVHEAQVQAKRVREERVFAKAVVYRRVSGQDGGGGKGLTYKAVTRHDCGVGKGLNGGGGDGTATNSEESVGGGFSQGWQGIEPPSADGKLASKGGHSRKSSGADSLSLRKVLSDSMNGMRKIRRSFTGSGSVSGSERLID